MYFDTSLKTSRRDCSRISCPVMSGRSRKNRDFLLTIHNPWKIAQKTRKIAQKPPTRILWRRRRKRILLKKKSKMSSVLLYLRMCQQSRVSSRPTPYFFLTLPDTSTVESYWYKTCSLVCGRGHDCVSHGNFIDVSDCFRSKLNVWNDDGLCTESIGPVKRRYT